MQVVTTIPQHVDRSGMSTREFATRARLTYNQALAIRRGAWTRIDLDTLGRVCEALLVEPGDLFTVKESTDGPEPESVPGSPS